MPLGHSRALPRARRSFALVALALAVALSASLSGCARDTIDVPPVNAERPADAKKPSGPDLTTPQNAVQSYLDFVSYAYLLGKSEVASRTMGPEEFNRVDSYIELDRQRGRRIDQRLDSITFGTPLVLAPEKQLLPAQETWTYRYVDNLSGAYKGPAKKASFTATYTVELGLGGGLDWLVTSVEATSSTPVQ